jgi:putative zinc finger/helix-turn-helix YgiT family protein
MNCPICDSAVESIRLAHYHYEDCGLPKVFLVNSVVEHRCTNRDCGESFIEIPRLSELHRSLALRTATQEVELSKQEIRFLRKHLGYSSKQFAALIGVTPETVSRWESGTASMGKPTERFLRLLVLRSSPVEQYSTDILASTGRKRTADPQNHMTSDTGWRDASSTVLAL